MRKKVKFLLYIDIVILVLVLGYKGYLYAFEPEANTANVTSIKEIRRMEDTDSYTFAVLGNIKNSIDIFDKRMVNTINEDSDINFVISTGNAVLDGSEDKYRILNKSFEKIQVPTITGFGQTEMTDRGALRFYRQFGPFYFSYQLGESYFIFLDTTGQTSEELQKEWLKTELEQASGCRHIFVFLNKAPYVINESSDDTDQYIQSDSFRHFLTSIFAEYKVDAVFASGPSIYDEREIDGVGYYVSGGAGGPLLSKEKNSFYHYMKITVSGEEVQYGIVKQGGQSSPILNTMENVWIFIHSLFYTNRTNFTIMVSILVLLAIVLYIQATKEVNYYRDFTHPNQQGPRNKKLTIAMFTNTYLPFIGGVPNSIHRLAKGLREQGHEGYIFAPKYPGLNQQEDDPYTIRCELMWYRKTKVFNFPIVNIYSTKIEEAFAAHPFDIVHVHHPFWMGKKGMQLARKYQIPVVFTYHTRFDSYYRFLPFLKLYFKNVLSHKMVKHFAQNCNAIVAPTTTAKEYLSNIGVSRHIAVLPTAIDFDDYQHSTVDSVMSLRQSFVQEGELLLCSVSRLAQEKNIFFLIDAIHYIKHHTDVPFRCIIVGDGPEKEHLKQRIQEDGLEDNVVLIGSVAPEEVNQYYQASDLFLFSSKSETQGMVILEAMAGHCPVVAVASSGIDDVVVNGENGYKTIERIEEWAKKVIYLMEHPKEREEMSSRAYHFAERYSIPNMAKEAVSAYHEAQKDYEMRHTAVVQEKSSRSVISHD